MTWWLIDGGGVLAVLAVAANYRWHPVRAWRYDWARAKHLVTGNCDWCGPRSRCTCIPREPVEDIFGSMTLAGEMEARGWLTAPELAHEDSGWRAQTQADLSPEALYRPTEEETAYMLEHYPTAMLEIGPPDSGPGEVVPLASGPDWSCPVCQPGQCSGSGPGCWHFYQPAPGPDHDDDWDGSGLVLDAWLERQREERERMTAMIVWPDPAPVLGLGPRAAWVLGCDERRHREKWAWQATGWSLAA